MTVLQKLLGTLIDVIDFLVERQQLLFHPLRYRVTVEDVLHDFNGLFGQSVERSAQIAQIPSQFFMTSMVCLARVLSDPPK